MYVYVATCTHIFACQQASTATSRAAPGMRHIFIYIHTYIHIDRMPEGFGGNIPIHIHIHTHSYSYSSSYSSPYTYTHIDRVPEGFGGGGVGVDVMVVEEDVRMLHAPQVRVLVEPIRKHNPAPPQPPRPGLCGANIRHIYVVYTSYVRVLVEPIRTCSLGFRV